MTAWLTHEELCGITGKRQHAAQFRALAKIGIRAWRRGDGSVCVLRAWLAQPAAESAESEPRVKLVRRA